MFLDLQMECAKVGVQRVLEMLQLRNLKLLLRNSNQQRKKKNPNQPPPLLSKIPKKKAKRRENSLKQSENIMRTPIG